MTAWDTSTGQPHMQTRLAPYPGSAKFSHDGKFLALAAAGGPVQVFDMAARRKMFELEQPVGGTNSIAFSLDGAAIATADGDTVVRILRRSQR